jgi:hypothetical protein
VEGIVYVFFKWDQVVLCHQVYLGIVHFGGGDGKWVKDLPYLFMLQVCWELKE